MPTIKRIGATDAQVNEAKAEKFGAGYGFSDGQILTADKVEFISHSIDGKSARNACPVITLAGSAEVIYVRSLIKERYDYKGEKVASKGTLNAFVTSLIGKTIGEVVSELSAKLAGKKLRAVRLTYQGLDRRGEVRTISYNEYDFVD